MAWWRKRNRTVQPEQVAAAEPERPTVDLGAGVTIRELSPEEFATAVRRFEPPRLTIELVPQTCWYSNLRSELSRKDWDTVRRWAYREAGYVCSICGGRGPSHPVEAHEWWSYVVEDGRRVQRLDIVKAICPACHETKHMGLANIRGRAEVAIAHLGAVNGWNEDQAWAYAEAQFDLWRERSRYDWTADLSWLPRTLGIDVPTPKRPPTGSR